MDKMLANISFFWDSPLPKRRLILPIALREDIFMNWKKKLAILLSSSISPSFGPSRLG